MSQVKSTPVSSVVVSVVTIFAVVMTLAITHDTHTTLVVGGLLITFAMQIINNKRTEENREEIVETKKEVVETKKEVVETKKEVVETKAQVEHVGEQINGRMTRLLEASGRAEAAEAHAAGLKEGHEEGVAAEQKVQAAREETPPTPKG